MMGCSSLTTPLTTKTLTPSNLLEKCQDLPHLVKGADLGDLVEHDLAVIQLYNLCQLRHNELADYLNSDI